MSVQSRKAGGQVALNLATITINLSTFAFFIHRTITYHVFGLNINDLALSVIII